jgi:uncharacterized protein (TIGR02145 family)
MKRIAYLAIALTTLASCSSDDKKEDNTYVFEPIPGIDYGSIEYEGYTYRTVDIGEQTWFAENLRYDASGSECYGEDGKAVSSANPMTGEISYITLTDSEIQANCNLYGRLYDWATAMALDKNCNTSSCVDQVQEPHRGICPEGWHVPSVMEWLILSEFAGDSPERLKTKKGWEDDVFTGDRGTKVLSGNGTDDYGFSALPGGYNGNLLSGIHNYLEYFPDYTGKSSNFAGKVGYWWTVTNPDQYYENESLAICIDNNNDGGIKKIAFAKIGLYSLRCLKD